MKLYKLHETKTLNEFLDPSTTMPSSAPPLQQGTATNAQVSELTRRLDALEDAERMNASKQTTGMTNAAGASKATDMTKTAAAGSAAASGARPPIQAPQAGGPVDPRAAPPKNTAFGAGGPGAGTSAKF